MVEGTRGIREIPLPPPSIAEEAAPKSARGRAMDGPGCYGYAPNSAKGGKFNPIEQIFQLWPMKVAERNH